MQELIPQDFISEFDSLEQFVDHVQVLGLKHLASDLLEKGFSPTEIVESVRRAIRVCEAAGISPREHFRPVYSSYRGALIRDCKLSAFGLALCLANGSPDNAAVASWQVELLRRKGF